MNIVEPKKYKVTFNFFNNENCSGFTFCQSFTMRLEYILRLIDMTENERLEELNHFLTHDHKGKSCEFYWRGRFYKAMVVDEEKKASQKEARIQSMQHARKNKNSST